MLSSRCPFSRDCKTAKRKEVGGNTDVVPWEEANLYGLGADQDAEKRGGRMQGKGAKGKKHLYLGTQL